MHKTNKKTGFSASQTLGSSSNTENPQAFSAVKLRLDIQREGKGPEKTQLKAQKMEDSAEKECPSPSQYELPPPGKVKLIPLPFLTLDKPQARPVSRRPHPPASRRPAVACPARPGSTNSAQSTAVHPSKPAPTHTSLTGPARPAQPISTKATQAGSTNHNQPPTVSQSAASRPAPYKTSSCSSLQRQPVSTAVTNLQSLPKPQNQFIIQDVTLQPRSWRIPDISGPVVSTAITKEQRPEREAMKRKAQQEQPRFYRNKEKSQDITDIAPFSYSGWRRGSKPQSKRRTSQACDSKSETQGPQKMKLAPRSHELERPCQGTRHITFRGCGFRSSSWPRSVQESRVPGPSHCGDGAIGSCESQEATYPMPSRPRAPVRRSQCQDKTLNRETRKSPTQRSRFSLLGKPRWGFHHVGQAGLEVLTLGDPPTLASKSVGIIG
ncbi:hypothetical protein AAY473_008629, partial [Plecturocebus cupreus]